MYALARHHLTDKHMEQRHDDEGKPNPLQHLCGVQIGHDPIACDRQVKEAPNRYHAQACDQDRTSLPQPGAQNKDADLKENKLWPSTSVSAGAICSGLNPCSCARALGTIAPEKMVASSSGSVQRAPRARFQRLAKPMKTTG